MVEVFNFASEHFERPTVGKKHDSDDNPKVKILVLGKEGSHADHDRDDYSANEVLQIVANHCPSLLINETVFETVVHMSSFDLVESAK